MKIPEPAKWIIATIIAVLAVMAVILFIPGCLLAQTCPATCQPVSAFQGKVGPWSYGILSLDAMQSWDIFAHVHDTKGQDIISRSGASLTVLKNGRFEFYFGATMGTGGSVALIGGPAIEINDVARSVVLSALKVLPVPLNDEVLAAIGKAVRLKIHVGYDFRYTGAVAGFGAGWAF